MNKNCLWMIAFSLGLLLSFTRGQESERNWTSADGRTTSGTLVDFDGFTVTLRIGEQDFALSPKSLSDEDQTVLNEWLQKNRPLFRDWQSSGGNTMRGEVFDFNGTSGRLRTLDRVVSFSLEQLAPDDQTILREWWSKRRAEIVGSHSHYPIRKKWFEDREKYRESGTLKNLYDYLVNFEIQHGKNQENPWPVDSTAFWSFLYVPESYDETKPFGVYLHINSVSNGPDPERMNWTPVFDDLNMIYLAPFRVGNEAHPVQRYLLAMDALATLQEDYLIDEDRLVIGGLSGGGMMAIHVGLAFPDVFQGVISHARGMFWRAELNYINEASLRNAVRAGSRMAFVSGPDDFNYDGMTRTVAQMQERNLSARFWDIPGMGHTTANPDALREMLKWVLNED